jgi:iron complex transport system substrate-binding protein
MKKFTSNMRPFIWSFYSLFLTALLVAACATSPVLPAPTSTRNTTTLTDGAGRSVTLQIPAQRIISLAPSNTEILFSIGAGAQMVGRDTLSDFPAEAKSVPDIGGGFGELNSEAILSAKADLVLAAELTPPEQIRQLEKIGLAVYVLPNPTNFEGLYQNLRTVAQLTGHATQADKLIASLEERVRVVKQKISGVTDFPLVFYELDGTDPNAPWTPGPGTFIDTLITQAGGKNVGQVLHSAWAQISIEELVKQNPDIILLGDSTWGGVTPEQVRGRTGWGVLKAVKDGQVFAFDDNLVSRPGPRLVEGLEAMAKFLHPELFQE